MDYFFRRPPQSAGHYNQHTNNQYGIGHLPPSACADLLCHSRTGGNPNTNTPFTPPTAEFVIPTQAGIQASNFQKRLESVAQSNSRLRGRLASADGNTERPYPMDYIFRRPPQSSRHYNQHMSNQYGIDHLPPSACADLLCHSRAGGNPGIGFSETLRICRTVKLPLRGGLASADGDMVCLYPMDYFFRRPPQSVRRWFRLRHDGGG